MHEEYNYLCPELNRALLFETFKLLFTDTTNDSYKLLSWETQGQDDLLQCDGSSITYSDTKGRTIVTSQLVPESLTCFSFAVKVKAHGSNTGIDIGFGFDNGHIKWRNDGILEKEELNGFS